MKLYCNANQNNIELASIIKQGITVFQTFRTLYTPVLIAVYEDTNSNELHKDFDDFQANVQIFIQAVERSNLNLGLTEHSDYMHMLCSPEHFEEQYRYMCVTSLTSMDFIAHVSVPKLLNPIMKS